MPDSQRLFALLGDIQGKQTTNHEEVVQRLTALETKQHDPLTCPAVERVEKELDEHKKEVALEKRDSGWKSFAKEAARAVVAAMVAIATSLRLMKQ